MRGKGGAVAEEAGCSEEGVVCGGRRGGRSLAGVEERELCAGREEGGRVEERGLVCVWGGAGVEEGGLVCVCVQW